MLAAPAYVLQDGTRRVGTSAHVRQLDEYAVGDERWPHPLTRSDTLIKGRLTHAVTIRPDGTHPALVFGNTPNCQPGAGGAGTGELVCTLMSHGDHHGPIALIDRSRGPFDTGAITNITPDTRPSYQMNRSHTETFRDPYPVSRDHFLVSHNPDRHHNWALYVIDRYGNRELLYVDPEISSKRLALCPRVRPPVLASSVEPRLRRRTGRFGAGRVPRPDLRWRGAGSYLRVAEEVPARLEHLVCGSTATIIRRLRIFMPRRFTGCGSGPDLPDAHGQCAAVAAGDQCQLATACRGEGRGSVRGDRSGGVAELRGEDVPRRGARGAGRFGELCGARVASVVFSVAGRRIQRDSADAERDPVAAGRAAQLHRVS